MSNTATAALRRPESPAGHHFQVRGWVQGVPAIDQVSVHIGGQPAVVHADPTATESAGGLGLVARPQAAVPTGAHPVVVRGPGGTVLATTRARVGRHDDEEPLHLHQIDGPEPDAVAAGDVLFVYGWALLDSKAPALVEVIADGAGGPLRARTRLPRPDVAEALPEFPDAGVSGFEARIPVDVAAGTQRGIALRIRMRSHESGEWTTPTQHVVLANPGPTAADTALAGQLAHRTDRWLAGVTGPQADPRHVLVFTHSLALGGGQLWLQELLSRLVDRHGWRATVITQLDGSLRAECEARGVPVHRTSPYRVGDVASYEGHVGELAMLAKASGAAVALVNTLGAFAGADAAQRAGLPCAWVLHESFHLADFAYQNWGAAGLVPAVVDRWRAALAHADRLLFVADATRQLFEPLSAPQRCHTIRYGTPMVRFGGTVPPHTRAQARAHLGVPKNTTLVFNLGVLEPRKGQGQLIAAMDRVRRRHPDTHLTMVGYHPSPYGRALAEYVDRTGLHDWVDLAPIQQDPTTWFLAADLFVNSSDVESLPRSILEAVCCGLPVVASDVFGARELIADGQTGWLFEANDVDAMTVGLLRALETPPHRRAAMAHAAFDRLRDWLAPDRYPAEYSAMLSELACE